MTTNHNNSELHKKLAHEIKSAKRKMFKAHREGTPMREAAEGFFADIAKRFGQLVITDDAVTNAEPSQAQLYKELTDEQIEGLAKTVCLPGDDALRKSQALLVLMDEAERNNQVPFYVRRVAFAAIADHDTIIDAEVKLLRSELTSLM